MARERTDPRKGAKHHSGKQPPSQDTQPTKPARKPKRLGGWGIFLLSVIAAALVINVTFNLLDRYNILTPTPEASIDPAAIESQAQSILNVPTIPPVETSALMTDDETPPPTEPTATPTPTPSPSPVPTPSRTPVPETTFDFFAVKATQVPDTDENPFMSTTPPAAQTPANISLMSDYAAPSAEGTIAGTIATTTAKPVMTRIALPTPTPTPTPSPTPAPRYGKSNIARLNIRVEPDVHSDRVVLIERSGAGLMIVDTVDDENKDIWYAVTYGRHRGYVLAQFVTEITEEEYWPIATRSTSVTQPPTTARPSATATGASGSLVRPTLAAQYIGDAQAKLFHLNSCIALPPKADRVDLASRGIAITNGYSPCPFCNP